MTWRIAHLTTVHPWSDTRIFARMCRSLAAAGHDVHLLAAHGDEPQVNPLHGVHIHLMPEPMTRWRRLTYSAWSMYRQALALKADIYHFHDPELIPVGVALRLHGHAVVYDVHEDMPKRIMDREWVPRRLRPAASKLISATQTFANKTLSGIVTATPTIAQRFSAQKTEVVCNYPNMAEFTDSVANLTNKKPTIVYVGTIDVTRGVLELIQGFARMSRPEGARLIVAGRRQGGAYDAQLDEAAEGLPVEFPGFINRTQVAQLLDEASVGAIIMLPCELANEAISTKMFEYMAAGIPVVTTDMPLWATVVQSEHCGTAVDPSDSAAVAAALEHWLNNPAAARTAGENGRRAVANTYNWGAQFPKLIELYGRLMDA